MQHVKPISYTSPPIILPDNDLFQFDYHSFDLVVDFIFFSQFWFLIDLKFVRILKTAMEH